MITAFPKLLASLSVTFEIVAIAILVGLFLGIFIAIIRMFRIPVLNQVMTVYISFMRGTPLIIQLYLVYYGLPMLVYNLFGVDINGWNKLFFIITAYALNEAAFLGEIIRGAILAVPELQTEAGYSTGMTYFQTFIHVVFPQAIRIAIPSFSTDLIGLFQGTSLAFLLGAVDVIGKARIVGNNSGHVLDTYVDAAIIFIVISVLLEFIFHKIQKRGDVVYGKLQN
jgi:L-cystine transport system permease protein